MHKDRSAAKTSSVVSRSTAKPLAVVSNRTTYLDGHEICIRISSLTLSPSPIYLFMNTSLFLILNAQRKKKEKKIYVELLL